MLLICTVDTHAHTQRKPHKQTKGTLRAEFSRKFNTQCTNWSLGKSWDSLCTFWTFDYV